MLAKAGDLLLRLGSGGDLLPCDNVLRDSDRFLEVRLVVVGGDGLLLRLEADSDLRATAFRVLPPAEFFSRNGDRVLRYTTGDDR